MSLLTVLVNRKNALKAVTLLDEFGEHRLAALPFPYAALPPPVRKACGFPLSRDSLGGYAARGEASTSFLGRTESQRLSARKAAKPQNPLNDAASD